MAGITIKNLTRRRVLPRAVCAAVAAEMLPGWDLSLAFVGPAKARALNKRLRKKHYAPNVLSYIAGKKSAEILICPTVAAKEAPAYQLSTAAFLLLLFIHGVLHIKGWAHGARMEACERKLLARYGATNSHRNRYRHVPGQGRRRRRALR